MHLTIDTCFLLRQNVFVYCTSFSIHHREYLLFILVSGSDFSTGDINGEYVRYFTFYIWIHFLSFHPSRRRKLWCYQWSYKWLLNRCEQSLSEHLIDLYATSHDSFPSVVLESLLITSCSVVHFEYLIKQIIQCTSNLTIISRSSCRLEMYWSVKVWKRKKSLINTDICNCERNRWCLFDVRFERTFRMLDKMSLRRRMILISVWNRFYLIIQFIRQQEERGNELLINFEQLMIGDIVTLVFRYDGWVLFGYLQEMLWPDRLTTPLARLEPMNRKRLIYSNSESDG